jgi:hypothetical protein
MRAILTEVPVLFTRPLGRPPSDGDLLVAWTDVSVTEVARILAGRKKNDNEKVPDPTIATLERVIRLKMEKIQP